MDDIERFMKEVDHAMAQRQAEEAPRDPAPIEGNSPVFQAVDDVVRRMANAATFGYADKFAAYTDDLFGLEGPAHGNLEKQRQLTEDAGKRLGKGAIAADLVGGVGGALATAPLSPLTYAARAGIGTRAALGAGEGVALSALDAAGHDKAWTPQSALTAAGIGGGLAGGLTALGRVRLPSARSADEVAQIADLRRAGVDLSAGQASGRRWVQNAESELGRAPGAGDAGARFTDRQAEQFNRATSREAGTEVSRFSPANVDRVLGNLEDGFQRITQGNNTRLDNTFVTRLQAVENQYANNLDMVQRPIFQRIYQNLMDTAAQRQIVPAEVMHQVQSELGRLSRTKVDPELKTALTGMRDAVLDAMQRGMPTAEAREFATIRRQYRNWMAIENSLKSSSAAGGNLSPMALGQQTMNQGARDVLRGDGSDLANIARAGQNLLKPIQDSGTAGRAASMAVPGMIAGAGGMAISGNIPGAAVALAGAAAPGLGGRLLFSNPVQRFLGASLPQQPAGQLSRGTLGALYGTGALTPYEGPKQDGPMEITVKRRKPAGLLGGE